VLASRLCHINVLWADEDYHLAAAIQVLHGKLPYLDFWYDKPPLSLLFYLPFGARTGVALRVADTVFVCLCCFLAYRFGSRIWSKREGHIAAALLAFSLIFYLIPGVLPLEPDTLMLAPHLAAVYLARQRKPIWAGVLAGIAFQLNVKGVFVLVFAAQWGSGLSLVIGFLIPNAIIFTWLGATGALTSYWEQVWKWGALYIRDSALGPGVISLLGWFGFHAALVVGAGWLWITERSRTLWWFLLALAFTLIGLRPAPRYFNLLLPPLIVAAAGGWALARARLQPRLSERGAKVPRGLKPTLLAVCLTAALALPVIRFGPSYINPGSRTDTAMDRESRAAATLVNSIANRTDTIFIWGYRPDIVAYTRSPVAGRIWDSQPLTGVPADRHLHDARSADEAWAARNRQELAQVYPTFLVDGLSQYNPQLDIHQFPDLAKWLSHYCAIGHAGGTTIYQSCRSALVPRVLLHKLENVEVLDFPPRKEAVDRILHFVEHLKNGVQLREQ
jgi:hypothetical protein